MPSSEQIDWLKTSIPGIILLGAVGSILAVIITKACRRLLLASATWADKFFMANIRPYAVYKTLAEEYSRLEDKSRFVILCVTVFTGFVLSTVILGGFCIVFSVYVLMFGLHLTTGAFCFFTLGMILLLAWFRDAFAAAGIWTFTFGNDIERLTCQFKSPKALLTVFDTPKEQSKQITSGNPR